MKLKAIATAICNCRWLPHKLLLVMKLTILLLIVTLLQVSAKGYGQKITLKEKNTSLEKVMQAIEKQSGYVFIYKDSELQDKSVGVELKNASLEEALNACFKDLQLNYNIIDKNIVISRKEKTVIQKVEDFLASPKSVKIHLTDSIGNPLAGATVQVTGDPTISFVSISDEFGDAKFDNINPGSYKITVSYIGYETIEKVLLVENKNISINLILRNHVRTLQAIAIVDNGYQQISAERETGAFDNIKKSQLQKPAANIAERLIGAVAGLQIREDADGNPKLELRGQTTLFAGANGLGGGGVGNNNPLVVVDGFPLAGNSSNPFSTINPNDVESITVLKDAAASSIWGAKAANGVIVITTKKGDKGTPLKVEFSAFTRFAAKQNVGYLTGEASSADAVNFEQYAFNKWGAYANDGTFNDGVYRVSQATELLDEHNLGFLTTAQLNAGLAQLKTQDNRSQISDYLLSHPTTTQYNLALSGGSQKITSYVSMMAEQDQTNFKGSGDNKYALNYRTNANVFKWLDFDLSGTFQSTRTTNNGIGSYGITQLSPYDMLKNPDGSLTNVQQYYFPILERTVPLTEFPYSFNYNPIQEIANQNLLTNNLNTRIQAGLTFKILPGLTFRSSIQYVNSSYTDKNYYNDQTFYVRNMVNTTSSWNGTLTGTVTPNLPLGGILNQDRGTTESYNFRNQLNFSKIFSGKHEINVVAGTEINNTIGQSYGYPTTYGYNDQTLQVGSFPHGISGTNGWMQYQTNNFNYLPSFGYATQRFLSYFANASYTYLGKYTVSGSYRTDASNLIATDPKFRYSPFYSAGLGYDITKEDFMKSATWLNRLNFRATYGRTGNVDNSTSPYTLINIVSTPNVYINNNIANIASHGNPDLTWEKTTTIDLGLDYSVLNNRLFGKFDVYDKAGKNLLANIPIPSIEGAQFATFNNAAIDNKGIEVTIGTTIPLKGSDISWSGSFTGSYNKSDVTTLYNSKYQTYALVQGGSQAYSQGYDPNTVWAYRYTGWRNGQPTIAGTNGTFLPMDYSNGYRSDDGRGYLENMGTLDPRYILGFTNSFKVYDFNVSFIIIAKLGAVFQSQYFNYLQTNNFEVPNAQVSKVLNGDPNKILTLPTDPNFQNYSAWIAYDRYLNYSYVSANLARLQELNISYNIPKRLLSKAGVKGAQLTAQGNNLYSWFANKTGEDPEYPENSGLNGNLRPRAQYTLGIKVEL